jgi:hypothetical protein
MNERIKELMDQAGIDVEAVENLGEMPTALRFAELIVKESMAMCDELKAKYLTSRKSTMDFNEKHIYAEGESACDIIKYKMKKQFGVE